MIVSDTELNLVENNIDLAIRIAVMKDFIINSQKIASNKEPWWLPQSILKKTKKFLILMIWINHDIISFQNGSPYNEWHFNDRWISQKFILQRVCYN